MTDRPRDLDHLVETYRLASARRAAGLPVWRWKVQIKDLLTEDNSNEQAQCVGREIGVRLHRALPGLFDPASDAFDDELDSIVYDLDHGIETVKDFNDTLEALYDWADVNRLWLG